MGPKKILLSKDYLNKNRLKPFKKSLLIGIVFVLFFLVPLSVFRIYKPVFVPTENIPTVSAVTQKTLHPPINLTSNTQLDSFPNKTGSGTESDPYIISNISILAEKEIAVNLQNINKYLVFKDCEFQLQDDSSDPARIFFIYNSSHITINGCEFKNVNTANNLRLIEISSSDDITIFGNIFCNITDNKYAYIIYGSQATDISIKFNEFYDIEANSGVYILYEGANLDYVYFEYNKVHNLTTTNIGYISIVYMQDDADRFYLRHNSIYNIYPTTGARLFYMENVQYAWAINNTLFNISSYSVYFFDVISSEYLNISGNLMYKSDAVIMYGIYFNGANSSYISENIIRECINSFSGYGIYLKNSKSDRIYLNLIYSLTFPAFDSSQGNLWEYTAYYWATGMIQMVGNYYWNYTGTDSNYDYIGDIPYKIFNGTDTAPIVYGALDNDQDGLLNAEEIKYGTELNNNDTDGDGLSDYIEVRVTGTDPVKNDTDGDGIPDSEDIHPLIAEINTADTSNPTNNSNTDEISEETSGLFDDPQILGAIIISGSMLFLSFIVLVVGARISSGLKKVSQLEIARGITPSKKKEKKGGEERIYRDPTDTGRKQNIKNKNKNKNK